MGQYTSIVNVFQGSGEIDLPKPSGIAETWHFIKGLAGNTHPGACLPFGKYSVCAYSGGYPSGYGINRANYGGRIDKLYDEMPMIGFSHFHHSGTGAVGLYYNYAVTSAQYGGFSGSAEAFSKKKIISEEASPGYCSARTPGIISEATVCRSAALHRYSFTDNERLEREGAKISVNFANDGLYRENELFRKTSGRIRLIGNNEAAAEILLEGLTVCFRVSLDPAEGSAIFIGEGKVGDAELSYRDEEVCGAVFLTHAPVVHLKLAVSLRSGEHAARLLGEAEGFDEARSKAESMWEDVLSRIEIDADDAIEKEIFYSNLYHSLVKPCDFEGESFIDGYGDGPFMSDLTTMWDIYKSELPLIFTLYSDISEKILKTLRRLSETLGRFPHCLLLSSNTDIEAKQARMLAEFTVCDGYYRGINADYQALIDGAVRDAARFTDFFGTDGSDGMSYASHILDMSEASRAITELARILGRDDAVRFFEGPAGRYPEAFGEDGMMRADSLYYEGNRFNYSFRPMYDMRGRIGLCGEEAFRRECLRFFGFTHAEDTSSRFEGFNNETDMESPYVLAYAGLRPELCQVIREGLDSMFAAGRGGIPGNNDSGGLSSTYIWNALGLYPMAGFDRMLLSVPRYPRAVLHMHNGRDLTIIREGGAPVPARITLNGQDTDLVSITVRDMMAGGKLIFDCRR